MAKPITSVLRRAGDFVVVVWTGEIDLLVQADLLDAFERAIALVEVPHLLVDVSGVTFMDSTGLDALVTASTRVSARRGTLAVVGANARIRRLLEIVQLDRVVPVLSGVPGLAKRPGHAQPSAAV